MISSRFSLACLRLLAASSLLALAGCATVAHPNPRDPWEPMNRTVSDFNEGVDAVGRGEAIAAHAVALLVRLD